MTHETAILLHAGIGTLALLLYWFGLGSRKGQTVHRRVGRSFFVAMWMVALSVGPLLFLRAGPFDPAHVVQFVYLAVAVMTVSTLGWTAIRWRQQPERFRGWHFRVLGPVLLLLGVVVMAGGLAGPDPVAVVLSSVGLFYGTTMIRFAWVRGPLHPTWWLNWHLNAVCGLFSAVHGTLLFVAWRSLVDPQVGPDTAAMFHLGALIASVVLRVWFGALRDVPYRFTLATEDRATGVPQT
ncbi:MAG: DUF2306 domain-containing protein [Burkholderiaceae bacterium]